MTENLNEKSFEKKLEDYIENSKTDKRYENIASCAITLLNAGHYEFSNKNYSKIRIPNANLGCAIIEDADFSEADLSNVRFCQA